MKDFGAAKKILDMVIRRDIKKNQLWANQTKYVNNVLESFSIAKAKPVSTPLIGYFILSV